MRVGEFLLDPLDGWVTQVVVVVVADDYDVYKRELLDLAGGRCISSQMLHVDGRTAVLEYGVKEDAQTAGILDVITCVAEPCRA